MAEEEITQHQMIVTLQQLEKNQNNIKTGLRILSEQLEKFEGLLIDQAQFRSYEEQFGGYGARNIALKLRDRGDQKSDASIRKIDRYRRTQSKPFPPLSNL